MSGNILAAGSAADLAVTVARLGSAAECAAPAAEGHIGDLAGEYLW